MELQTVGKLPTGRGIIGVREIQKGVRSGEIKHVIITKNCPDWLIHKITGSEAAANIKLERFDGDARELGTTLGKAFAVAMVGFKE